MTNVQWKSIVVTQDDNMTFSHDLNEDERLINKFERCKKRKLNYKQNISQENIPASNCQTKNQQNASYEFFSSVIFSKNGKEPENKSMDEDCKPYEIDLSQFEPNSMNDSSNYMNNNEGNNENNFEGYFQYY